jgi:CDP-glucose 4,6-dehydratase
MFLNVFRNKTVLVTGHTGFKGSWLAMWLKLLGANVIGYSAYFPSDPCNFKACDLEKHIIHNEGDIRDVPTLQAVFKRHRPDAVFHLAAQPIVSRSYKDPSLTFETNVMGTVNVLESIRSAQSVKAAVIITSDKCYQNIEWVWGYRENDRLGGDDPYSASKACAEITCNAYMKSFFTESSSPRISTARAGNVIGGGDWADARIVPDCVRAWAAGKDPIVRNPAATRPWQHVLEPLSGYLWLGAKLLRGCQLHGESFNFGPDQKVNKSVRELIETFACHWENVRWKHKKSKETKESTLLKLSCDKALHLLDWHPVLSFHETVRLTAEWYKKYYSRESDMYAYSLGQIRFYVAEAERQNLSWTRKK